MLHTSATLTPCAPCAAPAEGAARFRALLARGLDAVLLFGPDGAVLHATPAGAALMGYRPDELHQTNGLALVHPDDRARVGAALAAVLAAPDGTAAEEYRVRHRDGAWRWLEARAVNLLHEPDVRALVVSFRNVTARKSDEDKLRRSEDQYRRLFEASPHPMWVYDTRTLAFLTVNDAAVARYGYTRDEFARLTLRDIRPEEDVPSLSAGLRERGADPRVWRHRWKDGTVRLVEVSAHDLEYDGRPGRLVLAHDVTDRKRTEDELRRRDDRLSAQQAALLALGRDVLTCVGPEAALRRVTEETARALGVARVSVWRFTPDRRAIRCADLYEAGAGRHTAGTELPAAAYPAYFRALEAGDVISAADAVEDPRTCEFVTRYLAPLGIGAMLDVTLRPFGRPEGVLCCEHVGPARHWEADERVFVMAVGNLVSLAHERWERERAEDAARAFHARYEAAVKATGQVLYDWDAAAGRLAWGGSYEATLGYGPDELPQDLSGWVALVHPDDRPAFGREVERCKAPKSPFRLEYRVRRKDGAYITVFDQGHFVPAPGGAPTERVVGFVADVTDRKRLEEQFRQAQKMEAVGQLAGGVAHDFNNLLTVINGYSDIILGTLHAHSPARPMVEAVKRAGDRAADLTRQLLAFGRQQVLQPKVLDLNAVVGDTAQMLRRLIGEDVELVTRPGDQLLPVRADPGQVNQVLMNLAVNARDAMPTGGTLTIGTRNVALGAGVAPDGAEVRSGPYAQLSVSDTGTGMTEDVRRHIFEPFFTTKEQGKGTGLGLATVFGIVKQSGGHIEVETAVGRGTTFRVYLPGIGGVAAGQSPGDSSAPKGAEVVLVVEDEAGVRGVAELALRKQGYAVLSAAGAERAKALVAACARPVDLLVTDVVMPGAGGRVLAEQLRAACPQLKVLYMSGYTDDAVVRHGVEAARVNFIQKPFTPNALARKVREVLDAG